MADKTYYNHPNFLLVREDKKSGTISCPSSGTCFVGSTLRAYTKALVIGASVIIGSGGSVGGSVSLSIRQGEVGGTASVKQAWVTTLSAGASAANEILNLSLTAGFTLASIGDFAALGAVAASLADKCPVIKDIIWRYRILPEQLDAV